MREFLLVLQIFFGVLVVVLITIQTKSSGLSRSFGNPASFSRRGLEKLVYKATLVVTSAFLLISIVSVLI